MNAESAMCKQTVTARKNQSFHKSIVLSLMMSKMRSVPMMIARAM